MTTFPRAAAPDEALQLFMDTTTAAQSSANGAAISAHQAARNAPRAPVARIDREWKALRLRSRRAEAAANSALSNSAEWRAANVLRLRVALEAAEAMAVYTRMSEAERQAVYLVDKEDTARRLNNSQAIAAPPLPFNAADFLTALARRGVTLTLAPHGGILASAAQLLNDSDKATIRACRDVLARFLAPQQVA